jgi:ANTH domain
MSLVSSGSHFTTTLPHQLPEHYFEMSRVDANQALTLYRSFCKQTERVVEFLGVAKKLQNLLNVSIPNLKHVCRFFFHDVLNVLTCIPGASFSRRCT